jgi:hypothetical protein
LKNSISKDKKKEYEEARKKLSDDILQISKNLDDKGKKVLKNMVKDHSKTKQWDEEKDIAKVIEYQNKIIEDQEAKVNKVKQGLEGKLAAENHMIEALDQEQRRREKIVRQIKEQAQRQSALSTAVKMASTVVTTLTTISGLIKTINDDTISEGEKVERIATTLVMTLPYLAKE